jgi:hypothetical protein
VVKLSGRATMVWLITIYFEGPPAAQNRIGPSVHGPNGGYRFFYIRILTLRTNKRNLELGGVHIKSIIKKTF